MKLQCCRAAVYSARLTASFFETATPTHSEGALGHRVQYSVAVSAVAAAAADPATSTTLAAVATALSLSIVSAMTTAAASVVPSATAALSAALAAASGLLTQGVAAASGLLTQGVTRDGLSRVLPDVRVRLVDLHSDSLMDAAAASAVTVFEAELEWELSACLAEMEAVRVGDGGQRGQHVVPHAAGTKMRSARDC